MNSLFLSLALTAASSQAPVGPLEPPENRYRRCAEQVRNDPAGAVESATAWLAQGGNLYARQCLGLAHVALEQWLAAATVYEQAANEVPPAQDALRADLFVQAGNAWIAAEQPARAVAALDSALAAPGLTDELRGEVHLDRGRALVAMNDLPGARADLDRALQLVAADPFAWYLSAALARREGNLGRARSDIDRALEISPANPDFQLLAGTLAGLAGDLQEAERLYRRVVEIAPDSLAGRSARASLDTLRQTEGTEAPVAPPSPQQLESATPR